jgi:hypothetical protein
VGFVERTEGERVTLEIDQYPLAEGWLLWLIPLVMLVPTLRPALIGLGVATLAAGLALNRWRRPARIRLGPDRLEVEGALGPLPWARRHDRALAEVRVTTGPGPEPLGRELCALTFEGGGDRLIVNGLDLDLAEQTVVKQRIRERVAAAQVRGPDDVAVELIELSSRDGPGP